MTGLTSDGFEIDREFAAPPSAVFAAWTTPEHFSRWFGGRDIQVPMDRLDYTPVTGNSWSATMVLPDGTVFAFSGEFVDVVADERLVFTMTDEPERPERVTISVVLSATAGGTRMRMTQNAPTFTDEEREVSFAGWQSVLDVIHDIAAAA